MIDVWASDFCATRKKGQDRADQDETRVKIHKVGQRMIKKSQCSLSFDFYLFYLCPWNLKKYSPTYCVLHWLFLWGGGGGGVGVGYILNKDR